MPSFVVRVKTEKAPKRVIRLPSEENVEFSFDGRFVTFKTCETRIFDMYKIEC